MSVDTHTQKNQGKKVRTTPGTEQPGDQAIEVTPPIPSEEEPAVVLNVTGC